MPHPLRPRRSPEQWQQLVKAQAAGDQSQTAFCAEHGLAKSAFKLRKRRLRAVSPADPPDSSSSALFTPLMGAAEPSRTTAAWDIELDLGDGVCLRLRRGGV